MSGFKLHYGGLELGPACTLSPPQAGLRSLVDEENLAMVFQICFVEK